MILVPILAPLALAAGIDPLHFAIVVIVNLTLGMITPPVGGLLFVTSIVSGVPMGRMARELRPDARRAARRAAAADARSGASAPGCPALFGYTR